MQPIILEGKGVVFLRVLLTSLNAKYVHTNLAIRYLRETIRFEFPDTVISEFTINQHLAHIAAEIFEAKADVVGFSCYIWNLTETLALIRRLRPVCPEMRFVLGGPEVSYDPLDILNEHPEVDAIVVGEGEETFLELLKAWKQGFQPFGVLGVAWRGGSEVFLNPARPLRGMEFLPDPYQAEERLDGRLAYVETTRGCPFSCQYCLSSTTHGVRYLPPERFRSIFTRLLSSGTKTIKFVDRTFNVDKKHAFTVLDIVREEVQKTEEPESFRVHCEMAGDLLDEDWLVYLRNYPPGLLQFEIGVQSTHQPTLDIIRRKQHFRSWQGYVQAIQAECGIPIHLDLIAGLPEENWDSFKTSFNEVFAVQPDMLQLGFLKVLKGSGLRRDSKKYGLIYLPDPPYTILQTSVLTHAELLQLQRMEEVLNRYYNSRKFVYSLGFLLASGALKTPFDLFSAMADFWHSQGWFSQPASGKALFARLWIFLERSQTNRLNALELERLREALRLDYCLWERPQTLPEFLVPDDRFLREQSGQTWDEVEEKGRELRLRLYHFQGPAKLQDIPEMSKLDRRQWSRNSTVQFFLFDPLGYEAGQPPVGSLDDKLGSRYDKRMQKTPAQKNSQETGFKCLNPGVWYLFLYHPRTRILRLDDDAFWE